MKLLLDENLSRRLLASLRDHYPESAHVSELGLMRGTPDMQIWEYAKRHGFVILTADTDFVTLANSTSPPPKVILLENCDYPTEAAARLIRDNAFALLQFAGDERSILILRHP
jgi:predicted nuclease of predicted toxin-antitoxin system